MNRRLVKTWLIILIILSARVGYAHDIQLNSNEKTYVLSHPMFLVDNHNTPINQVPYKIFKASKFPTLSLGATTSSVWIKISIQNKSKQNNWHIQIDSPPVLQSVSVYQQKNGRLIKVFTRDTDTPKGAGDVRVNNLMIPITVPVDTEAEFYIKASSNNILRLPIKVTTLQNALEESYRTDLLHGIVFGMLIAFAIYNLFVYIITKEQPYLHYLGYIFFWSLNVFFYNGFLPDILSDLIWLNSAGTIIAIASILSVIFTNSFLQTRNNSPFLYKIRWLMCLISLVILFTDIFWKGPYSFMIVQYMMYPFFLYWFGAGIQSLKNGYKPAIYFILGFGFLMLGNAIYNLKDLDILPDNLLTRTSMHWGTLLEALILSFALASRLNFYRKQQEQIQLTTIEEKRAFLRELLRRQEQEKRRIAMELHDNIGQQLILIKNRCWRLQQLSRDDMKKLVSHPIQHIASIMAEVREILHRLRPYQMDLLGLTQSINSLITDTFTDVYIDQEKTDEIDEYFNADESMHIFRILQLLTAAILAGKPGKQIRYAIIVNAHSSTFKFEVQTNQQILDGSPDIQNRLELLKGHIHIQNSNNSSQIELNIPFTH